MKKKAIPSCLTALLLPCCALAENTIAYANTHPEKYTFQCVFVICPVASSNQPISIATFPAEPGASAGFLQQSIEEYINTPGMEIIKAPIVLAGIGESVTNDQTRAISLPEDYDVVDGKAVAKEKLVHLGQSVSITLHKVENGLVEYEIHASHTAYKGFDEYPIGEGITAKMPFFETRAVETKLTHKPYEWIVMGGLINELPDGTRVNQMICVRVIPPKGQPGAQSIKPALPNQVKD